MREEVKVALDLLLKRGLISLPFLALSVFLFIPLRMVSILSPLPLVVAGILVMDPLSQLIAEPTGSVFNPRSRSRQRHLAFSFPEARIMDGRYDEALDLYREMLEKDSQRLEVYFRMMDLAFRHMERPEIALETFSTGIRTLDDQRKREILSEEYRRLRTVFRDRG